MPINRSHTVFARARTSSVVRVVFVANFDPTFAAVCFSVVLRNGHADDVFDTLFPNKSVLRARLETVLMSLHCCIEV